MTPRLFLAKQLEYWHLSLGPTPLSSVAQEKSRALRGNALGDPGRAALTLVNLRAGYARLQDLLDLAAAGGTAYDRVLLPPLGIADAERAVEALLQREEGA
jgi:hypothetical protein